MATFPPAFPKWICTFSSNPSSRDAGSRIPVLGRRVSTAKANLVLGLDSTPPQTFLSARFSQDTRVGATAGRQFKLRPHGRCTASNLCRIPVQDLSPRAFLEFSVENVVPDPLPSTLWAMRHFRRFAFSPNGRSISVVNYYGGDVLLFDLETGQKQR